MRKFDWFVVAALALMAIVFVYTVHSLRCEIAISAGMAKLDYLDLKDDVLILSTGNVEAIKALDAKETAREREIAISRSR